MKVPATMMVVSVLALAAVSRGAVVINVQMTDPAGAQYMGTAATADTPILADRDSGKTWNPAPANSTVSNLLASDGTPASGVSFNSTSSGSYPGGGSSNNALLGSYSFSKSTETNIGTFTLSGLTGPAYDLYLYSDAVNGGSSALFTVNSIPASPLTGGSNGGATSSSIPYTTSYGVVMTEYSGLIPTGGVISGSWTHGSNDPTYGAFNGLQLVLETPEPASAGLLALGALGLLARRRR